MASLSRCLLFSAAWLTLAGSSAGLVLLTNAGGCSPEEDAQPKTVLRVDQYEGVRGRIKMLPSADSRWSEFQIHHEAIPGFRTRTDSADSPTGMNSMIMPFSLAPGVSLEGLSVGDPVEFDWRVTWYEDPQSRSGEITAIRPLPDDAELNLSTMMPDERSNGAETTGTEGQGQTPPAGEPSSPQ